MQCTIYFNRCFNLLGFEDANTSKYSQYFSRGELPTSKRIILKIWFLVLEEYHIMIYNVFRDIMHNFEGHITYLACLQRPCVSSLNKNMCKRALHAQQG